MNGARAEPFANTKSAPNISKKMTIGASHHFLRTRKKSQNSFKIASLFTAGSVFRRFQKASVRSIDCHGHSDGPDRPPSIERFLPAVNPRSCPPAAPRTIGGFHVSSLKRQMVGRSTHPQSAVQATQAEYRWPGLSCKSARSHDQTPHLNRSAVAV